MILVFVFGALGAGVSVLQRLQRLDEIRSSPVLLFCTGLTKPLIGAAGAIFLYVLVTSGIIAIDLTRYDDTAFFATVAFLAGFSERLLPDLARRVEGVLTVGATDQAVDAGDQLSVPVLADPAKVIPETLLGNGAAPEPVKSPSRRTPRGRSPT